MEEFSINKLTVFGLVAAAALGGGLWYQSQMPASPAMDAMPAVESASAALSPSADASASETPATQSAVKEFAITADNFSFAPDTITVKRGDTVRITLKNANGFHDLKIDEFDASTKRLQTDEEETIEFIADKSGQFEYYCSVGSHRAMGMKGTLVVEE